jgi:hypothetical protein
MPLSGAGEMTMPKRELDDTVSSGNVFADLGLPNPEELLAKAELANKITVLIRKLSCTDGWFCNSIALQNRERQSPSP